MIQNSTGFAEAFAQGSYTQMEVVDIVHFCLLHIQLYAEYVTQSLRPTTRQYSLDDGTRVNAPDSAMWANLWKATGIALRAYLNMERQHAIHGRWHYHRPILLTPVELLAKDQQLAGDCLEIMGSIERGGNKALQSLSVGEPVFPDDLIAILGHFILAENIPRYPRLARLLQEQESRWSALAASVSDLANEAPPTHATEFRPDPLHHQSRRGSFRSDSQEGRPASPFVVPPAMSEGSGWAETTQEDGRGDVQDGHGDSDDTTASTEGHLHEPGGGIGDGDTHIHEGDADVEDSTSLIGGGGVEGHGRSVSGHEQPDQGRPEGDNEGGERSGE
ncbi:uncharacterized protein PHACADRAFT_256336 [Phanerochaete carnosa HHB-10118-sp]|uniref:Uncharacterized protein n=1 Tax=Phanerochaete carnosa (strain HHB-10118-sp) TaxID=650164 RepID=K5W9F2_PHACS|nr:uncharacterized protein PHACADRAFT_256336 [Phanerochaete carnosa HHB-10118-sp]EKM55604.1 hypothetical protein PHACADRAFT_256336 [Phanerochaete carnosa HHB-10118-sp]